MATGYGDTTMLKTGFGTNVIPQQWYPNIIKYAVESNPAAPYIQYFEDLGKGRGDTINITRRTTMTTLGTAALTSGTTTPTGSYETANVQVIVSEYGQAMRFETGWADILAKPDISATVQDSIAEDYGLALGRNMCGVLSNNCGTCFSAQAAGSYHGTTGAAKPNPATNLEGTFLRYIRDYMRRSIVPWAPQFPGYYAFMAHPDTLRVLKNDADFINSITAYAQGVGDERLTLGIVGRHEGFYFIENTMLDAGTSYALGGIPIAWAAAMPLKVVVDPDIQKDFGRSTGVAWFSWYGSHVAYPKYAVKIYTDV